MLENGAKPMIVRGGAFMSAELTWEWDVSQPVIWCTYGGL